MISMLIFLVGILSTYGIPLEDFYPYGRNNSDERVPTNDDGSSPKITISTLFPYFNQQFSSLFVNTNGAISFSQTLSTFTPSAFPLSGNRQIVAPYWCDIDTRHGGDVWFYETNDHDVLSRASGEVREIFADQVNFEAAWVFVATWDNVAFYGSDYNGKNRRNTFQCILITNGRHSFTIFLYNKIQWTTGTASGGNASTGLEGTPAQVGFDAGDGFNFKAINESRTSDVINVVHLSNIDIPGKFVYRIDTEIVKDGGCTTNTGGALTIFPRYGSMFGGTELSIGGPCVTSHDNVTIRFEGIPGESPCSMQSIFTVRCVTPMVYDTGDKRVTLSIKHENGNSSIFSGIYNFINPAGIRPQIIRVDPLSWQDGEMVTIQWERLPFNSDLLTLELFRITNDNALPQLTKDHTISDDVNNFTRVHAFTLRSVGAAAILRIRPTTNNQNVGETRFLPSVWSDVFIVKPSEVANVLSVCDSWEDFDKTLPLISRQQIDTCPCTITQARLDISRFSLDPQCNMVMQSADDKYRPLNCLYYRGATQCFRMAFASHLGYDNECCYGEDGGLLKTDTKTFGGTAFRHHYKGGSENNVPYLSNIQNDIVPYMYCCQYLTEPSQQEEYCMKYLERRPPSLCEGYVPPRTASTTGDPHLVTLDGLAYTFNGVGEFTLLKSTDGNLTVQARMEQFKDEDNNPKPASVITSVALQCDKDSDVVEIRLNSIRLCDVLLNRHLLDFEERNSIEVKGSTIFNSMRNSSIGDIVWTMVSCRMKNIAFNITSTAEMININVVVADQTLRGQLKGLLGNYNGRIDDDFITANGSAVSANASTDVIHNTFGTSWRTNSLESLFTYPIGKSHTIYQDDNFRPVFNVDYSCKENASRICGSDEACQFDFCTTGSEVFAESTKVFVEDIQQYANATVPGCGKPRDMPNGSWMFSSNGATLKCNTNYKVTGLTDITCGSNGQWTSISSTRCDLIPCDPVSTIQNGKWIVTGQSASLDCDDNYNIKGRHTISCVNGKWESTLSVCILTGTPVTQSSFDKILWIKIGVPVAVFLLIVLVVFVVLRSRQERECRQKHNDNEEIYEHQNKHQDSLVIPRVQY